MVALVRLALGVGGGLALALAYPPYGQPWVAPLAVAVFLVAVAGARTRPALVVGLLFGLAFVGLHAEWMRQVSDGAWIGLTVALALFYALIGLVASWLWRLPVAPFWIACAWTAIEGLRSTWPFGGMPWGQLAFAVVDTPLMHSLPYVGTTGVTFALAFVGALLARLVVGPHRLRAVEWLVVVAVLAAIPVVRPWHIPSVNGVSGVIRPDGSIQAQETGSRARGLEEEVPLVSGRTPADLAGSWPWRGTILITVGGVLVMSLSSLRRRRRRTVEE
ncbi:hypothetical protein [Nocardioides sp. Kera G14]|uniref:hypothetical protein n=1 Tax=Nocardioides sp. Kera G14 TaxID=2884264 RepID=UPI001D12D5C4|nr:hypothetical protein [Nocardioides sp. Kera G14]UDY25219.1 hypothetical protein LH076_08015 [Nocardioides sp. Kera G14]